VLPPCRQRMRRGHQRQGARHVTETRHVPTEIGIDIGKNSFHIVGQNQRGAIVLRQKWSRGQVEVRLANLPPCRTGMEACVGAHHLSRTLKALGHDARLMPAKKVCASVFQRSKAPAHRAEAVHCMPEPRLVWPDE
jgi:transposase